MCEAPGVGAAVVGEHGVDIGQACLRGVVSAVGDAAVVCRIEQVEVAGRFAVYAHHAVDFAAIDVVPGEEGVDIGVGDFGVTLADRFPGFVESQ